jgi:sphingomyelin phosphodiesterase acid-like 3
MRLRPVVLAIALGCALFVMRCAPAGAAPWLFVSDIHLEAGRTNAPPSRAGNDTNSALFESAIRAMQHVAPHPPVVVVTGDLLAHDITKRTATPTAVLMARRLNRAFPNAQFVLALGNDDSACGDYGLAPDSAFLKAVAAAWEPLVNRRGAAPAFSRTFIHDGFYTASLPVAGLRAIVLDDVFWSPRYRAQCGAAGNAGAQSLSELETALGRARGRVWVLFHIPPGVDAFSTADLAHRLAIVPFLTPSRRDRLVAALGSGRGHIALAVAGHTHRFAYRIVNATGPQPVPMLLVPAVSPIFGNAPSFLTANVDAAGTLHDVDEFSYRRGEWSTIGGMRSLGVTAFTGAQLVALQGRLAREPPLRETFARLYVGGGRPEIYDRTWSVYWCAATAFATAPFRDCTQSGGFSVITERGVKALGGAALAALLAIGALVAFVVWRRLRRRGAQP